MNYFRHSLIALGAAALLTAPALAQPQGGGRGMGMMGGSTVLLTAPAAHAELGISEDQAEKLMAIADEIRGGMREKMQGLRDLPPAEQRERRTALMAEVEESVAAKVKDVLDAKQMERFEQIRIQMMGLQAFGSPVVVEKLEISDDQKSKMKELTSELETNVREAMQDAQGDFRAAGEKIMALRKEALARAVKELSEEQKKAWAELIGKPFVLPPGGPGGRPPGAPKNQ